MATWKYGPEIADDSTGYGYDTKPDVYELQYNTTADMLVILVNGISKTLLGYAGSRTVAKMMVRWFLNYELNYSNEFIDKLIEGKIKERI